MIVGFVDIREYLKGTEGRTPEELYGFLADFYEQVLPIAEQHGGRLVKTIGDAAMIVWPSDGAGEALQAAGEMRAEFERLREEFADEASMRLAVSLAMGPVIAGEMGPPSIRRYDVIGDAANRAALQLRRADVVVSQAVAEAAGDADLEGVEVVPDE
jgi:adenylate cyclase